MIVKLKTRNVAQARNTLVRFPHKESYLKSAIATNPQAQQ